MRQTCRYLKLHLHTFGELSELLLERKLEPFKITEKCILIPLLPYSSHHACKLLRRKVIIKRKHIKYCSNTLLNFIFMLRHFLPKKPYLTAVPVKYIKKRINRCSLTGTILSDKSHNASLRNIKAYIIKCKSIILLRKIPDLYCIFVIHNQPPNQTIPISACILYISDIHNISSVYTLVN